MKFAPTSFLDSNRYIDTDETLYEVDLYKRIIEGNLENDVFKVSSLENICRVVTRHTVYMYIIPK